MVLTTFQLMQSMRNGVRTLSVKGPIDEKASFPNISPSERVIVDLVEVLRLNSTGTRTWCLWMASIPASAELVLENCPVIVVKNFTGIKGFLRPNCTINSFAVPFYSQETDERRDIIFRRGENFGNGIKIAIPKIKDSKGNVMEVDISPEQYFGFLS